jgi:hypothetical protein
MEGDVFFLGKVERQRCFAALRGVFRWNSRYSALITACGTAKHWQRAVALLSEAQLKPRLKVLLNRYTLRQSSMAGKSTIDFAF